MVGVAAVVMGGLVWHTVWGKRENKIKEILCV